MHYFWNIKITAYKIVEGWFFSLASKGNRFCDFQTKHVKWKRKLQSVPYIWQLKMKYTGMLKLILVLYLITNAYDCAANTVMKTLIIGSLVYIN